MKAITSKKDFGHSQLPKSFFNQGLSVILVAKTKDKNKKKLFLSSQHIISFDQIFKGQLISKCSFVVIVWTKITTKKFDKSCPTHSRAESVNFFRCYFGPNEQKNILKLIDL